MAHFINSKSNYDIGDRFIIDGEIFEIKFIIITYYDMNCNYRISYSNGEREYYEDEISKEILISELADEISSKAGDTFIDFHDISPVEQWNRIIDILKNNGYKIEKYNG